MAISLCVVGATGKFGRSIISLPDSEVRISGAVCSDANPLVGKRLNEIGLHGSSTTIRGASNIAEAAVDSDVIIFVSRPNADLANIPKIVTLKKRIVVGTTGFTAEQTERLNSLLQTFPTVISSNFSIGANILFQITSLVSRFNKLYDYSIMEAHHKMKADAPSGTAKTMLQLLNSDSAFRVTVTDRTVKPNRTEGEVEVVSLRGGGTPGIHQLILSGEHDMIRVEHASFSRAASAAGALLACKWIASQDKPGIYSMANVLATTLQ